MVEPPDRNGACRAAILEIAIMSGNAVTPRS
jgi:hypothetical protein